MQRTAKAAADFRRWVNDMKIIIFVVLAAAIMVGCKEQPTTVSPSEFTKLADTPIGPMIYTEFVGVKDGQAILLVSRMSTLSKSRWNNTIYTTDVTKIDPDVLKRLKAKPKPYR